MIENVGISKPKKYANKVEMDNCRNKSTYKYISSYVTKEEEKSFIYMVCVAPNKKLFGANDIP